LYRYPHCSSFRLWKTYCEDEGVRSLCTFLERCNSILVLELLDNKITYLGCEFLGKTLTPGPKCPPICILKLDHNQFGSKGLCALIEGIHTNENLKLLSFSYCGLDVECSRALFEMLIYSKSKVEELILTGNALRNEGTKMVLQGVSANKSLKKIYLADNQFNEDEDMLKCIQTCMLRNKVLAKYDFRHNDLKDDGKYIDLYVLTFQTFSRYFLY
jgi:Ran GTPase-activating protein (RanGAP) involved in mRNA processing and transport